jgi:tRNA pseudouridine55 synthase
MNGALIIDKPEGITSHTAVARVRRAAGTRRVGHAGTLDPFASGVLVVCVGRATRLVQFLVGLDKEYLACVRLGFATDTQDLTGKQITPLISSNEVSVESIARVLDEFTGEQSQLPPMYSAKKVAGERLYKAAREGREVARSLVTINIHSIELVARSQPTLGLNEDGTRDFNIRVRCTSGTYIRTLAHDIGARLGVGAHLAALRRTAVGGFDLSRAMALDEVERAGQDGSLASCLTSPAEMLPQLPLMRLDEAGVRRVANGCEVVLTAAQADLLAGTTQPVRLCDEKGELIAIGEPVQSRGSVKPRVVLSVEG